MRDHSDRQFGMVRLDHGNVRLHSWGGGEAVDIQLILEGALFTKRNTIGSHKTRTVKQKRALCRKVN